MTNFFDRLAARALGSAAIVHPRLPGLFEPLDLDEAVRPTEPLHTEEIERPAEPAAPAAGLPHREVIERLVGPAPPAVGRPLSEPPAAGGRETALPPSAAKRRAQSSAPPADAVPTRVKPPRAPSDGEAVRPAQRPIFRPGLGVGREAPGALGSIKPSPGSTVPVAGPPPHQAARSHTPGRTVQTSPPLVEASVGRMRTAQEPPVLTTGPTPRSVEMATTHPQHAERAVTPEAPTIRVTIGRVDVRALVPPAPTPRAATTRRGTAIALDDYLKQQRERRR